MGRIFFCTIVSLFFSYSSLAYLQMSTGSGVGIRWRGDNKLNFVANSTNRVGMSRDAFSREAVLGLQRWQKAGYGQVRFDYWEGTDNSIYLPVSGFNGQSGIFFVSNASGSRMDSSTIAVTQVFYDQDNGEILDADIMLNDLSYQFVSDPRATTGTGAGTPSSRTRVFLGNVLTHEIGHAFGLSHSGFMQSTMLPYEAPEQVRLHCDDMSGLRSIYADAEFGGSGTLEGRVITQDGHAVYGANVIAISRRRGVPIASTLSRNDGNFTIKNLEPGPYIVLAEPFVFSAGVLSPFYSGINPMVCSGRRFSRTFMMSQVANVPESFVVPSHGTKQMGTLSVKCEEGAAVSPAPGTRSARTAPPITDGALQNGEFGFSFVDANGANREAYYLLRNVSGSLDVSVMAHALQSPLDTQLSLLDTFGNDLTLQVNEPDVYQGVSGLAIYDSHLVAESLAVGDYILRVRFSDVDYSRIPAGSQTIDSKRFLAITGTINPSALPWVNDFLPHNARCAQAESFGTYASPSEDPPGPELSNEGSDNSSDGFLGLCGRVKNTRSDSIGSNLTLANLASWFLPWLLVGLIALVTRLLVDDRKRPA